VDDVVTNMSMPLDGFIEDATGGMDELFAWMWQAMRSSEDWWEGLAVVEEGVIGFGPDTGPGSGWRRAPRSVSRTSTRR
jgi:hypothetical protein